MSKLLIDDYPIQVLPKLAEEIGLNEAIILQQIHYWLNSSKHNYDGKKWIYNSYPKWIEQFPFWSESTIKRTITSLEKQNLVHVGNYNKVGFDRTKWYSINYTTLNKLMTRPSGQNDPTMRSNWHDGIGQNDPTNTRDYTETTTETTNNNILSPSSTAYPYRDVIDYLNQQTGKNYKSTTKKNQTVIRARTDEGFTLNDFKQVIDNKVSEWKGTDMEKYLRPETLFGTKFEGYLNQQQSNAVDEDWRKQYEGVF
ncbi:conserved phage C-terminal domain-containing protein [Staphylococcus agnetis]|uniref:conserved phage C-terminal domain-containing protein n=1 Tax=Staphylococcus agnetis TaxID=985762 RepID=UPI000D034B33|nr:conserved phage C-terminal domain-containing protein [Staphylococcus agnetis]MCO4341429.1 conserved phage C-terminal domain-containing protein [Staphylococcus agnetis]MCO4343416.1 conserved phage C-terminal domain-containing protein [Staphylococcus agnetis]MCO4353439.1 conserved phage C-terminal domain-containing protein [Staphylococcus agnetis]MCO4367414.1 conserved phage C-terminal domain-containing protein [Staphylococcus agnetis]